MKGNLEVRCADEELSFDFDTAFLVPPDQHSAFVLDIPAQLKASYGSWTGGFGEDRRVEDGSGKLLDTKMMLDASVARAGLPKQLSLTMRLLTDIRGEEFTFEKSFTEDTSVEEKQLRALEEERKKEQERIKRTQAELRIVSNLCVGSWTTIRGPCPAQIRLSNIGLAPVKNLVVVATLHGGIPMRLQPGITSPNQLRMEGLESATITYPDSLLITVPSPTPGSNLILRPLLVGEALLERRSTRSVPEVSVPSSWNNLPRGPLAWNRLKPDEWTSTTSPGDSYHLPMTFEYAIKDYSDLRRSLGIVNLTISCENCVGALVTSVRMGALELWEYKTESIQVLSSDPLRFQFEVTEHYWAFASSPKDEEVQHYILQLDRAAVLRARSMR